MMNFICVTDDILRVIITKHPHLSELSMAKVRPKKNVVFGPAQLVEDAVAYRHSFSIFFRLTAVIRQDSLCLHTVMK